MLGQKQCVWMLRKSVNYVWHYLHFDGAMVSWEDNMVGARLYPVREYAEWAASAYGGEVVRVLVTVVEA